MATFDINKTARPNILALEPYSCARTEFTGEASTFLDANESPYNDPYNRYPDPFQKEVKKQIAKIKGAKEENIFLGNGSDEAIDLMYRIFTTPGKDNAIAITPTYGMYGVCADINDVEYRQVELDASFQFTAQSLLRQADEHSKIIWLCSPNNPTGNALNRQEIIKTIEGFDGIVVLDEAYIDFSAQESFVHQLDQYHNLVILQTFSKAWASAGIRLGMAFASTAIIGLMNKVKYPYNVNILTQKQALDMLSESQKVKEWVETLTAEREKLSRELAALPVVRHVYPSDANFILVKVTDANMVYQHLVDKGIIIRNRNNVTLCGGCVRISVGTPQENNTLMSALKEFKA